MARNGWLSILRVWLRKLLGRPHSSDAEIQTYANPPLIIQGRPPARLEEEEPQGRIETYSDPGLVVRGKPQTP